jgi:hypothetical protein
MPTTAINVVTVDDHLTVIEVIDALNVAKTRLIELNNNDIVDLIRPAVVSIDSAIDALTVIKFGLLREDV